MEELIHYVWKHKIFPLKALATTDGQPIEVIDPGLHNHGAGPDFFNAKVRIDGQLWVGNVEIHVRASDWFRHNHQSDPAYDNVILHVVGIDDAKVPYPHSPQRIIPQMVLGVPDYVKENYDGLTRADTFPRCAHVVSSFPKLVVHSWMSALQVERLEERSKAVKERWEAQGRNWEETLFVTIARNFGFGKNGDAFERWAKSFPLISLGKHRDSLMQIEAVFFGQAGMLNDPHEDYSAYYRQIRSEYLFMQKKFSLKPIDPTLWKMMRLRPENFPQVRIAQLAMLYYQNRLDMSRLIEAADREAIHRLLQTNVSDYWTSHYSFKDEESPQSGKRISPASIDLIIMNSVVPLLFAYGRYKGDDSLCDRAFDLMEQLKPENNRYIRDWENAGISCESAADSQALMQLSTKYCEPHNCLRCRFGVEYIRRTPNFLSEEQEVREKQEEQD